MKKKILICLLLVFTMAVSLLTGCGSQQNTIGRPEKDGKISISMYM